MTVAMLSLEIKGCEKQSNGKGKQGDKWVIAGHCSALEGEIQFMPEYCCRGSDEANLQTSKKVIDLIFNFFHFSWKK